MITILNLKCPNCGGELQVQSDREFCFCQYCGTKILLSDENKKTININKNVTYTTVNEADKLRAENERLKLENDIYKERETEKFNNKFSKIALIIGPIVTIICVGLVMSGIDLGPLSSVIGLFGIIGLAFSMFGLSVLVKKIQK